MTAAYNIITRTDDIECGPILHNRRYALELAGLMNSARLVIGNQCGLFAVAEQLKVPRWLESCQLMRQGEAIAYGCPNVLPLGGKCRMLIQPPTAEELF